jgi:hypothetical protein
MSVVNGTKLAGKLDSITPSISLQVSLPRCVVGGERWTLG